jgi:TRAP-type C4-dicarboxylate transport system permease small subunit
MTIAGPEQRVRPAYVRVMDKLYLLCMVVCVVSIVCMTVLIFFGVISRYFFEVGARFAEPMSIFFTVQLTMYGAAMCYRSQAHLRLELFVRMLPDRLQHLPHYAVHVLMAAIACLMVFYGYSLAETTWFQSYPEFDEIRVGVVYSAIPGGGAVLLLFVIERVFYHDTLVELEGEEMRHAMELAEKEASKRDL